MCKYNLRLISLEIYIFESISMHMYIVLVSNPNKFAAMIGIVATHTNEIQDNHLSIFTFSYPYRVRKSCSGVDFSNFSFC